MRELEIDVVPARDGTQIMVVTGLRAGHLPAVNAALLTLAISERARFNYDVTSGIGATAEDFQTVLSKAMGHS